MRGELKGRAERAVERWKVAATAGVDAASTVALRVLVGGLLTVSALRFVGRGWVEELLLAPRFHFRYWGFEWVPVPGPLLAYALFVILGLAGLSLAWGRWTRASAAIGLLSFAWIELIDLSYYLNHYVFLSALLLCFTLVPPRGAAGGTIQVWKLALFRVQIGLVYVYAGVAKLGSDWLLRAQPLDIWFARHGDLPLIGAWMNEPALAYLASWSGALFDLLVIPAMLYERTRRPAYLALVGFHVCTGLLFPIGMFPWFMIAAATIFLAPDWPRWMLARAPRWGGEKAEPPCPGRRQFEAGLAGLAWLSLAVQLVLPWRHLLYPGSVIWHEQGARYAYRVMLVEKAGSVEFRVHERESGRSWRAEAEELTPLQRTMMSTQPDLIAAYARALAARLEQEQPGTQIEVYADVFVAVNGRPSQRLLDPTVNLAAVDDGLCAKPWILPGPADL